jgi:hypothetical protein
MPAAPSAPTPANTHAPATPTLRDVVQGETRLGTGQLPATHPALAGYQALL